MEFRYSKVIDPAVYDAQGLCNGISLRMHKDQTKERAGSKLTPSPCIPKFISHEIGPDDYCCIFAYGLTITFSVLMLVGNSHGLDRHLWDVPATEVSKGLEMLYIAELIYTPLVAIVKLSCLLFYWRLFNPSKLWRRILVGAMTLLIATYTGVFFATLLHCRPIEKSWNPFVRRGSCLPPKGLPYASGAINVASDVCVLIIPIPAVWSLNMKVRRKFRVLAVFSLAIFAVIASIVRLAQTPILYTSVDRTWNVGRIQTWAVLQLNIGIICACLLAFPAFLDRYGVVIISRVRSYTNILRSTASHKAESTPSEHSDQTTVRNPYDKNATANDSLSKCNGSLPKLDTSGEELQMQNFPVGDVSGHMTHRADIEYIDEDLVTLPEKVFGSGQMV